MTGTWSLLAPREAAAAKRVVDQESARREHLVVYLSGAHAYGFPSPDSDLDLKCVHVAPTRELLGLRDAPTTVDRMDRVDGVEIDYTSNELRHAITGILAGNGNFLERVLGDCVLAASPLLAELRPLVLRNLSTRFARHYVGFASAQERELAASASAKKLLYVFRTTLTGAHLLRTGELRCDVRELLVPYGFEGVSALIERKLQGERVLLDEPEAARWQGELRRAFALLLDAEQRSPLPQAPEHPRLLEELLLDARRARF